MEINWDSIKYIFQVPKDWYSYIHRKIHNAYGTLFIRVLDGEYGGMKIDIDRDLFNEAVEDAVDLDGYVKSVNNIEPDENGNVDLDENFLEASDITTPGIVVGTDYKDKYTVCSPNHKHKVKDVEGAVKTVNGNPPDEDGNVVVEAGVRSVNDIEPDEDGNVDLGGIVYSVNGHEPDEDGNVEFSVVESVDGVSSVDGNVPLGAVRSINGSIRPVNGNVDLTGVFAPTNHTHPHTQISDWSQATISFLETTDITSPGEVVGTDYDDPDHPVCSPNHKHNIKDIVNDETNGFVTLDTEQTITGAKSFVQSILVQQTPSVLKGVEIKPEGVVAIFNEGNDGGLEFLNLSGTRVGGIINQSSGLTFYNRVSNINIACNPDVSDSLLQLTAPQNRAVLLNPPSADCDVTNAIATVGWVKEKALTVPDGKTPQTQTITLVTNVTWNGTQLVIQKKNLEFSNGVLTNVTNATNGTIDTVAYSPT